MTEQFRFDLIAAFVRRGHRGKEIAEMVREIEALLDSQRCVWTKDTKITAFRTSCGKVHGLNWNFNYNPMCPCCGKRISIGEVKDGQT